jgi:3',5'-cyclic AMP phosphodiesterase CpdA
MAFELTTVADDEAVLHDEHGTVRRYEGLSPDTDYEYEGHSFRTLPRLGERLATVCTVNDVHFGETECGVVEGLDAGEVYRSEPGEEPYPDLMNRCAIAEIAALAPDAVVAKGDLTARGLEEEYEAFVGAYAGTFGDRLHHVRGNHDAYLGATFASDAPSAVTLPGVILAVIDTTIPTETPGQVTATTLDWLDEVAASADRPVMVFGHHHPWSPDANKPRGTYFGINPDDSERLIDVAARRPAIVGYFAGHTHRNRVRRIRATGDMPWVEVACVKDYPGSWAEYRVYDGGITQIHRRISAPEALAWTDKTRGMFHGLYTPYAFGALTDRCFVVTRS